MVLYYHMLNRLVYPLIRRHEERGEAEGEARGRAEGIAEGEARGRVEGIAEGEDKANKAWRKWNQARMDAEAKGLPFDEPPPDQQEGDS